jgi:two-component system autoinducer 1 sensor kinase/phosphatase LuxN
MLTLRVCGGHRVPIDAQWSSPPVRIQIRHCHCTSGSPFNMTAFPESPHSDSPRHNPPNAESGLRPDPSSGSAAGGGPAPVPGKRSLRVLCIDDDEQILETMQVCLGHLGHTVKVASGGKRGIELFCTAVLKSEPYDVVITDMSMPDVNGYQVSQAIRAESPKTPIILLSGAAGTTKETEVPSAFVDAVVNKPASLKQLDELLLRLTGSA